MSEFKLETGIPIPAESAEDAEQETAEESLPEETSEWVPFKPNQPKCTPGTCKPPVGRCLSCGDLFPCPSGNCGHADCADPSRSGLDCPGNGTTLPEWLQDVFTQSNSSGDPVFRGDQETQEKRDS